MGKEGTESGSGRNTRSFLQNLLLGAATFGVGIGCGPIARPSAALDTGAAVSPAQGPAIQVEADGHVPMKMDNFFKLLWRDHKVVSMSDSGHNIFCIQNAVSLGVESFVFDGPKGPKLLSLEIKEKDQKSVSDFLASGEEKHLSCLDNYINPEWLKPNLRLIYLYNKKHTENQVDVLCMDDAREGDRDASVVNPRWVGRIKGKVDEKGKAGTPYVSVLVVGGGDHSRNTAELGNRAGRLVDDFDELLSKALGTKVADVDVVDCESYGHLPGLYKTVRKENRAAKHTLSTKASEEGLDNPDFIISTIPSPAYVHLRPTFGKLMDTVNSFDHKTRRALHEGVVSAADLAHPIAKFTEGKDETLDEKALGLYSLIRRWDFGKATKLHKELETELAKVDGAGGTEIEIGKSGKHTTIGGAMRELGIALPALEAQFEAAKKHSLTNRDYWKDIRLEGPRQER